MSKQMSMSWETEVEEKRHVKVPASKHTGKAPASDLELVRACKLWDKITTKAHNREYELPEELQRWSSNQAYSDGDYGPLQCRIDGKHAELTVGSSSGHKAKVDLEKGELEYFDDDHDPNQEMKELLEETAGLKCEADYRGVKCKGVKHENVQAVFRVLAMPTSMDFRLDECKTNKEEDPAEGCQESCQEDLDNNYNVPSGCDCSQWQEDCVQECVDNAEPSEDVSETCIELDKQFFRDGPKLETLTKKEAEIIPSTQKKMMEFEN